MSAESTKLDHKAQLAERLSAIEARDKLEKLGDDKMRPKPVRENSYLTAVRNSTGEYFHCLFVFFLYFIELC